MAASFFLRVVARRWDGAGATATSGQGAGLRTGCSRAGIRIYSSENKLYVATTPLGGVFFPLALRGMDFGAGLRGSNRPKSSHDPSGCQTFFMSSLLVRVFFLCQVRVLGNTPTNPRAVQQQCSTQDDSSRCCHRGTDYRLQGVSLTKNPNEPERLLASLQTDTGFCSYLLCLSGHSRAKETRVVGKSSTKRALELKLRMLRAQRLSFYFSLSLPRV